MKAALLGIAIVAAAAVWIGCERGASPDARGTPQDASAATHPTPFPAESRPAADGRALFDEAIAILSTRPMGRDRVDWPALAAELRPAIPNAAPPAAAHDAIRTALARLNDRHAQFITPVPPPPVETAPAEKSNANEIAAGQPAKPAFAGPIPTEPAGRMLEGQVAYVVLPTCSAPDVDGLRSYALQLRSAILNLESQCPRMWIVEMRFNGGGNCWPMFLGLRPLLGDGVAATSILDGRVIARMGNNGATAWMDRGDGPSEQLRIDPPPEDRLAAAAPVAVLIGRWTGSSGELATLAFIGHPRTRLFGEPTAGLVTVNNYFPLSDGSVLNLPVESMADRTGRLPGGSIKPDELIEDNAWPGAEDRVAARAIAWGQPGP